MFVADRGAPQVLDRAVAQTVTFAPFKLGIQPASSRALETASLWSRAFRCSPSGLSFCKKKRTLSYAFRAFPWFRSTVS